MSDFDLKYSALRCAVIEREFSKLNPMQRKAVYKTEGPLLLLAGAGSGKTTVLINRIVNLLRFGCAYECKTAPEWAGDEELKKLALAVDDEDALNDDELRHLCAVNAPRPYEIIAITFTNKAAAELRDRLKVSCGQNADDIWAQTFHSACTRILRRYIDKLGYSSNFAIYDDDDKKKVVTAIIKDFGFDEKRFEAKGVMSEISHAKDNLISVSDYESQCGEDFYRKTVARFFAEYEKRMQASGALDFDDIICKTVELLRDFEEVRSYYQHKFKYVLVDEYQDTNHAQYMLCSLLAGGYKNLCVVGDDDQSIYKFRGATITNILEFEQQYTNAETIRLEQNYRSTTNILSAANTVISQNVGRKGKTLWTENGEGVKVKIYTAETQEDEAQYIAKNIQEAHAAGDKLKNFTVLYRNHALSNSIEVAFKRNSLPYRIVSGLRFFDRAEVKDMIAYLWVINNPVDSVRLHRVINNPSRKIGAKALESLAAISLRENLDEFSVARVADTYPELSRSAEALKGFAGMIDALMAQKDTIPLIELYEKLLDNSGYLEALKQQGGFEAQGRIENIMELKSNIAEYCAKTAEPTLSGFLEDISLFTDLDRYDTEADTVTMMTIHSAKGLEFDTVFICGAEEGIFPSHRSMDSVDELEEERRLCYVAMTRAKRALFITCARRRMLYGQTTFGKPSRFIEEIPEEYTENIKAEIAPKPVYASAQRPAPRRDYENYRNDVSIAGASAGKSQAFRPGEIITHKVFGKGKVLSAAPVGGDTLLEIAFDRVGTKMMMGKTASQYISKL